MTTTNLRRRLEALEQSLSCEPIVLLMPDGRTETLPGHNDYVLNLLGRAVGEDRTPEVELIARSVSSREPDAAHMIDLVRALLNGPAGDAPETRRLGPSSDELAGWKTDSKHSCRASRKVALRIIVTRGESETANLATSTCTRRLNTTGGLIEIVDLDGADSGISEEELEQFIASFPIDPGRTR